MVVVNKKKRNLATLFVSSTPPDNLSIQEFQKNEAIDVEVRFEIFISGKIIFKPMKEYLSIRFIL